MSDSILFSARKSLYFNIPNTDENKVFSKKYNEKSVFFLEFISIVIYILCHIVLILSFVTLYHNQCHPLNKIPVQCIHMNSVKSLIIKIPGRIRYMTTALQLKKLIKHCTKPNKPFYNLYKWKFMKPLFMSLASTGTALKLINSEVTEYDIEENIAHLMALARIALEKGDTERAEAILNMGIKISDEYKVFIALPYMYDVLATIAIAKGETGKAEVLLVNIIEKLVQLGVDERDNQIVDFKLRLSRIYSSYKEDAFAEIGFRDCLNIQTRKILDGDRSTRTGVLYVNCLFWYGLHRLKLGDYIEAKDLVNRAYGYSIKIKGLSPYQEMVILYTMADLNLELEEYDVALQNMQNAILLAKGIGSVDLSRCYVKLARIYIKLSAWDSARNSALEGAKLAQLFNDPELLQEVTEMLDEITLLSD